MSFGLASFGPKRAIGATLLLTACAGHPPSTTPNASASAVATTRWFSFHSNQWVNLHHFLYVTARARTGLDATRSGVTRAMADTAGFGQLSAEQRIAWSNALDTTKNS